MPILLLILILIWLPACQSSKSGGGGGGGNPTEKAYCSGTTSFPDPVAVTGVAKYEKRTPTSAGLVGFTTQLSRFAEVSLVDATNNHEVNCGETDTNGSFSIAAPRNMSLLVVVRARSFNSNVKVSVLSAPSTLGQYEISTTASTATSGSTVNATPNGTELVASRDAATGIKGGAFNIQAVILTANETLRTKLCGGSTTSCALFSVAPKVTVFWQAGLSPAIYVGGSATDTLSFYMTGASQLYLQGGVNGNTTTQDTDHYDDAVIAHEYGHFIEDMYGHPDSPGGSHDGKSIIDPRLAWGEGWANFFGSLARGENHYFDTYGNDEGGSTGTYIYYNIDTNTPSRDLASAVGEGNFREFAITRTLWDAIDAPANGDLDGKQIPFTDIWNIMVGGFKASVTNFRNAGQFFALYEAGTTQHLTTTYNSADSRIDPNSLPAATQGWFGMPLTSVLGSAIDITANDAPPAPSGSNPNPCTWGSFDCSNLFASNRFYFLNHDGSGKKINLAPTGVNPGGFDLDLLLYNADGYQYGVPLKSSITQGTSNECIDLSAVPAGTYLVNVFVYTGTTHNPGTGHFKLTMGAAPCP